MKNSRKGCTKARPATLAELEAGAGVAVTGGGSRLPMPDLIRAAAEAYHYLVIFNGQGKVLHLGRSKRTASAAQRIALHGRDHGCTRPGCTASGYQCQVHHLETDWADGGLTDIDTLTLACGPDNRMCTEFGWDTRLNSQGRVEWIPPPGLDHGQPRVNSFHHPQDLLAGLAEQDSAVTETRLRHVFGDRAPVPTVSGLERSSPPTEPDRHDDDIYRRLLEYERMKRAALRIDALPQANRDYQGVSVWISDQIAERLPEVSLHDLQVAWLALMKQAKMKAHHKVRREELSVREYMGSILRGLRGRGYVVFEDLFEVAAGHSTVASLVVSFLAVLELAREKLIEITQSEALAPIYVKCCDVDDLAVQA